jgi:UPF0042 nucleotide-binding protein
VIQEIALVTGPAGAGRTTAIRALEDLGFEAIDNLPLSLMPRLLSGPPVGRALVVGVDPRTRDFSVERVREVVEEIAADPTCRLTLVYVDCSEEVLLRRYAETRRRHPSSPRETPLVGIERDKRVMEPLLRRADILIDTTDMTPHDLRAEMARHFDRVATTADLAVTVQSFSYKRGLPRSADMVLDCRFLRNPHWDPDLRPLDGRDPAVAAHVASDPNWSAFFDRIVDLARLLLPACSAEGKSYFNLALGCTGGRHRSVAMAEALGKALAAEGWQVSIRHRDLERSATEAGPLQGIGAE